MSANLLGRNTSNSKKKVALKCSCCLREEYVMNCLYDNSQKDTLA